ncbi:MAG TPA: FAD-binding oxidoreductase [Chloroflexota bacterium]|nr:FAD-binding oxidoreductase [Chloroflexota bacterium]
MVDVIVVGGGIAGASVTYRLARDGVRVTLLEAGQLGNATSLVSFAWINASNKPPLDYHLLNVAGMGEHAALLHEFGRAPWLHLDGCIEWASGDDGHSRLRAKVARLRGWGYHAELLPASALGSLEPSLAAPPDVAEIAYYPTEGYVDTTLLVGFLAQAAQAAGATVRRNCRVVELIRSGERVRGVRTANGEQLNADVVVSCVGRWTAELAELAGIRVPLAPTVGMNAISAPAPVTLRAVIQAPRISLRPDGAGRIMLRHEDFDAIVRADTPVEPVPSVCADMLERAARVLPGLAGTRIEAARVGVRPIPADGYSVIGPAPAAGGLYLVCTHSAVTMGPLLGRVVAREIVSGDVDPRINPFRPERLVTARTVG